MIEECISNDGNKTYLRILSQYRLLGMANAELQFEMAMRDQIIHKQREAQKNLWNLLMGLGVDEKHLLDLAAKQGITIEDWAMSPHLGFSDRKQSPNVACVKFPPLGYSPYISQSFSRSCIVQQCEDFGSRSSSKESGDPGHTFHQEVHHSSYFMLSHDQPSPAYLRMRRSSDHLVGGRPSSCFSTPGRHPQDLHHSCPEMRAPVPPRPENYTPASCLDIGFSTQYEDAWNNNPRQRPHEGPLFQMSVNQDLYKKGMVGHHG